MLEGVHPQISEDQKLEMEAAFYQLKKLCVPLFGDGTLCLYFLVEKKENLDIQLMFLHVCFFCSRRR